jgi:hypothetical protein
VTATREGRPGTGAPQTTPPASCEVPHEDTSADRHPEDVVADAHAARSLRRYLSIRLTLEVGR